jgi:hypothetical protein
MTKQPSDDTTVGTGRRFSDEVTEAASGEELTRLSVLLCKFLEEEDPHALVGAEVGPGVRTTVDGSFDLGAVLRRFLHAILGPDGPFRLPEEER